MYMPDGTWIGGIYLKDEGGHEIVLRSIRYYLKILGDISVSPGDYGPPTIARLLQQEANKMGPVVLEVGRNLKRGLTDPDALAAVQGHIPHIRRALESYEAGLRASIAGSRHHRQFVTERHRNGVEVRLVREARLRIGETV